jgi:hypothetical protein
VQHNKGITMLETKVDTTTIEEVIKVVAIRVVASIKAEVTVVDTEIVGVEEGVEDDRVEDIYSFHKKC